MKKRGLGVFLVLVGILIIGFVGFVRAEATEPTGPESVTRGTDERLNTSNWPAQTVQAIAGNLTVLTITATSQTQTWQGYYGNISGTITLDDTNNFTMYDWALTEPQGEIYAANKSSVNWTGIKCFNYTSNVSKRSGSNDYFNLTDLERMYGLNSDDVDGVDETFNSSGSLNGGTVHSRFYVGTVYIGNGTCPATDMYQNDSETGDDFVEVLLSDRASIVFTTIIENDANGTNTDIVGYDSQNRTYDFQMIVGDNGHDGDTSVTNYYFFVELE